MLYNLSTPLDQERFRSKALNLLNKGAIVELTEKTGRSSSQNRYLHVIIGVVAMETGNQLEYTKEHYYKRLVNPDIFVLEKQDRFLGSVQTLRSSRDLTVEEMRTSIDRFQRWAAENGIYIPAPEDEDRLREIEVEMARMKTWL